MRPAPHRIDRTALLRARRAHARHLRRRRRMLAERRNEARVTAVADQAATIANTHRES